MLRVSPTCRQPAAHAPNQRATTNVQRAFAATRQRQSQSASNRKVKNFHVVELQRLPAKNIDLREASLSVHRILTSAQEIARRNEVALEGPPSDSLESLLAMRIKQAQK